MAVLVLHEIFNDQARSEVEEAIRQAERSTSAEIRVHAEDRCNEDPLDRAAFIFAQLGMHDTALRNGVLIYVSLTDQKVAIIGDAGIHSHTEKNFWNEAIHAMTTLFREQKIIDGVIAGVKMCGNKLALHYPISHQDSNELSNEVTLRSVHHKGRSKKLKGRQK